MAASGQNVFFDELLAALESELRVQGVETERATDHFPTLRDDTAYLFVPHEYVPLTLPDAHPSADQLRRSVALCTEQPGTHWFDEAAAVAERAGAVIDINGEGVRELRRRGIDAELLTVGWVPEWDHWGGDETRARPFDLTFMGAYTQRRAEALAGCSDVLSRWRSYINVTDDAVPNTLATGSFLAGGRKWEQLASSRLLLNIHRSPLPYLEWQRLVGAIANGCVVVTEHSLGCAPLVPGEHFISTSLESLPEVLDALLEDPAKVASVQRTAYSLLREELPLSASIGVLTDALDKAATGAIVGVVRARRHPRPRPRPAPAPISEYERLAGSQTDADVMRMALKHVLVAQSDLRRQLDAPQTMPDVIDHLGDQSRRPRASVVLTVFNYAHTVGEAVASVAASEFADIELVVVDDASTDASDQVVRQTLARFPALTATIVTRGRNQGLPQARNAGVRHARGDYVFILDADNAVFPHCLGRLVAALDSNPDAAFAYGLLEVFDAAGSRDLLSWRDWDPAKLRYGNYVDAMAMIRRSVLESVGGYTTDPRLFGWEDFALWCTVAEHGWTGVRVPEILARYRKGLLSMISLTDVDGRGAWAALLESHPFLTAPMS